MGQTINTVLFLSIARLVSGQSNAEDDLLEKLQFDQNSLTDDHDFFMYVKCNRSQPMLMDYFDEKNESGLLRNWHHSAESSVRESYICADKYRRKWIFALDNNESTDQVPSASANLPVYVSKGVEKELKVEEISSAKVILMAIIGTTLAVAGVFAAIKLTTPNSSTHRKESEKSLPSQPIDHIYDYPRFNQVKSNIVAEDTYVDIHSSVEPYAVRNLLQLQVPSNFSEYSFYA